MRNVIRNTFTFLWRMLVSASKIVVGLKTVLFYPNVIVNWLYNDPGVLTAIRSWVRSVQTTFMNLQPLWLKIVIVIGVISTVAVIATAIKKAKEGNTYQKFSDIAKRLANVAIVVWAVIELLNEDLGWGINIDTTWMSGISVTGVIIAILVVLLVIMMILLVRANKRSHADK